ncbi:MAG TPA: MarR family transcriptional regulator, partial [Micromonosporaceae bacterium]|nr:MarR family transcriptional regulator [Micromonosporaceae bacterium]
MDDREDLANRLHSAAIHLLRAVSRADAESGLSPARLSALSVIVVRGPLTMTELAGIERVSPATITSTVSGLEAAGFAV